MKSLTINTILLILIIAIKITGCQDRNTPMLSQNQLEVKEFIRTPVKKPVYGVIPPFSFLNQDSLHVNQETFEGKIYIAEFFFTSCPTICPKMKTQLLRVYDQFKENPQVLFLSHTIDPVHDSVAVLREYARQMGVKSSKWHFVTGDKDKIYKLAQNSYMITATDGIEAGKVHSGAFILVDSQRRIRGIYDGTSAQKVDKLMQDIQELLAEEINL